MRMLTEEERMFLTASEEPVRSWSAHAAILRLARDGRVKVERVGDNTFDYETTAMGERALKIDALIRQWGFGS